ncbi:LysR substrate-binding domain-containing protein [Pseudogemmobacter sp. W21_MBD1_M6]|uniref:LysR family transcriptional regulator n=1 Tax=Pseudogemmobacter sp. W21_MBD1_M6 TaxID=3240271 RepID=UPI003F967D53
MSYVNTLKMFVRVYELGSMSAAARDQRTSPAVASSRISELEKHLGVRLFNRTTRALQPTEHGSLFYDGAQKILDAIAEAEAAVGDATQNPRGTVFVGAPLGVGRRFIAPHVPAFKAQYPQIDVRLRMSDRIIDVTAEGLDVAFHLGILDDSTLKLRTIADCPRILCASPDYIARRGMPHSGTDIVGQKHDCLNLRFPGAKEFQWTLDTAEGPRRFDISGPFESDDGDVLTGWALDGHGIVMKPVFEVVEHLTSGALVPVARATPPMPIQLSCLYPHRRFKDPKIRLFLDFMIGRCKAELAARMDGVSFPGMSNTRKERSAEAHDSGYPPD